MPASPWPVLDHPGTLAFAHRGGAADGPENTLANFQRAVDLGYRYLESDVRATADGVALAFHDEALDRVTDASGRVEDLPWARVKRARVGGSEPILRLEELLGAWPDVRLNLDPKHDAAVVPLAEAIRRTASLDRVCVAAFSGRRLRRLRRLLGPRLCTAVAPTAVARLRMAAAGVPAGGMAGACVQVPLRWRNVTLVERRFLAAAHCRALQVHVWTVDEAAEMVRLLDLGVDGIMTDRPAVLKAVLQDRGDWS